ncbi:MAG TPA: lipoyl synthase [Phycisphaerae bacterium]|nr:lipoyl synthase [Phycisphaerae bacterium]
MTRSLQLPLVETKPEYAQPGKKPSWLRVKLPAGPAYAALRQTIDSHKLHTVCESAKCPNMGECWARGTATVMILGDVCTRSCGFCNIATGRPPVLDLDEPRRVADAVRLMKLKHCVITSVNRDELADGGAKIWARTITEVRKASPGTSIEVLIPDFCGNWEALQAVLDARPDILNHNTETVPSQYKTVRPQAKYERTRELLRRAKAQGFVTKTGLMVGIGETDEELLATFRDLRGDDVDILTIGQYLQPTRQHLPIARWVTPEQFAEYKRYCLEELRFAVVESGPLVRSSYHAEEQAELKYLQSQGKGAGI